MRVGKKIKNCVSDELLSSFNMVCMSVSTCQNILLFLLYVCGVVSSFRLTVNGPALGAVADFGALNFQYTTKVDAI